MKNLVMISYFLLLMTSTSGQGVVILGKIQNPKSAASLTIARANLENNSWQTLETVDVQDNGAFQVKSLAPESDIYDIFYEGQQLRLLVSGDHKIELVIKKMGEEYALETKQLETMQYLKFKTECKEFGAFKPSALLSMTSALAIYATSDEWEPEYISEIKHAIERVFQYDSTDRFVKKITDKVNRLERIVIGSPIPEINLPDNSGVLSPISKLRGKYVLVDFWASWCGPCRKENPNLVKVYNEFKARGFSIYGVSFDQDKQKWLNAIKSDSLVWTQVSDLQGWGGSLFPIFNIQDIPSNILIDRDGNIIARNIYGDNLRAVLAEKLKP